MKKYEKISENIKKRLEENNRLGITKLPSENEIAHEMNVSRVTVRRALDDLRDLGYIESRVGSGSYSTGVLPGKNRNIAVVLRSSSDYIYPRLINSIRQDPALQGFILSIYDSDVDYETEAKILDKLISSAPCGIIADCFSPFQSPNYDRYQNLKAMNIPIVFLNGTPVGAPAIIPSVRADDIQGGALAVQKLITAGRDRIAGIFSSASYSGTHRCYGFITALRDASLSYSHDRYILLSENEKDLLCSGSSCDVVEDMISSVFPLCNGIVCGDDEIAYALSKRLDHSHSGASFPNKKKMNDIRISDIRMISIDRSYLSQETDCSFTSLGLSPGEPAHTAVSTLLDMIKGQKTSSVLLPFS